MQTCLINTLGVTTFTAAHHNAQQSASRERPAGLWRICSLPAFGCKACSCFHIKLLHVHRSRTAPSPGFLRSSACLWHGGLFWQVNGPSSQQGTIPVKRHHEHMQECSTGTSGLTSVTASHQSAPQSASRERPAGLWQHCSLPASGWKACSCIHTTLLHVRRSRVATKKGFL